MSERSPYTDYGTNEIHQRQTTKPELMGKGHSVRMRVQDQTELDSLRLKGAISQMEHSAGESFARDLHRAKLMGMATVNFISTGGGGDITQSQADALLRVGDVVRYLDASAGETARSLTMNVCLSIKRATGDDVSVLKAGLAALLDFYQPTAKVYEPLSLLG